MRRPGARTSFTTVALCLSLFALSGCSDDIGSYRDLEDSGNAEQTIRKRYASFFRTIGDLEQAAVDRTVPIDSTIVARAASATDGVVGDMLSFPSTLDSRIAFDAISYAAADIASSPMRSHPGLWNFRQQGLLAPLFSTGQLFMDEGGANAPAHLQILKGLQRGMADQVTEDMINNCISVLGVAPSEEVMAFCDADTAAFKQIHDLIIYSRSLQSTDPPLWLLSGNWLCAMQFGSDQPTLFLVIVPRIIDEMAYLSFRNHSMGEVYSVIYDDPEPKTLDEWDTWYLRANGVMKNLEIDDTFAEQARTSGLSTGKAHFYYDDYLVRTDADSVVQEITISFVRRQVRQDSFEYVGMDSLTVHFDQDQIVSPGDRLTAVTATREIGASLVGGQLYPKENLTGAAYFMPLGEHDQDIVEQYRQQLIRSLGPEISFETVQPGTPAGIQEE